MLVRPARSVLLTTAVVLVAAALAGLAVERWYTELRRAAFRESFKESIQPYAAQVAAVLERRVSQISSLMAYVETARDAGQLERGFATFSAGLAGGTPGVRAVEIVRSGRIAMVYPRAGNERALGLEFMGHSNEVLRNGYQRALRTEQVTIVGPLRLVQGGDGLILFLRVHAAYDPAITLVEMVLDMPSLLQAANLVPPPEGLSLQLRDRLGRVLGAPAGELAADPVIVPVATADGTWELRGAPSRGWDAHLAPILRPIRLAIALIVLLVAVVAYQLSGRQARLSALVEQRTVELRRKTEEQAATIVRQQETERALQTSEERLRLALAASRSATFEIDVATGNMTWSEGVGPVVGRPAATSPDTLDEAATYVEPEHRARIASAFAVARERASHGTLEVRAPGSDGAVTWLALTYVSRPDADGVVHRIVGTLTDISERKRLEEQFLHAQKMQAMGALAGGVAHDFNNLLTVIIGASHLARRSADAPGVPATLTSDLDDVLAAAQRASVLTGQLLAFSRRQVLQPRHFDMRVLVGGTETMLRRLVGETIRLETVLPGDPLPVFADQGQLTQVVMNLAINARDAMPSGGTLLLTLRGDGKPDGAPMPDEVLSAERYAVLSVADTGVGIDPAIRSQIFHPFFTTKPVGQGTGLGLATVYGIVMQLGGTLRVHSELGRGSTFEVYLPIEEDSAGEAPFSPGPSVAEPGRGRTVLLAEDEPALRALAQRVLSAAGYRLIVAEDGYAALEAARAHQGVIDLLVSDIVMPRLSGLELATILLPERPQMRVLLLSGYPQRAAPESAVLLGDVPFLAKPFGPDDLLTAAQRALAQQ